MNTLLSTSISQILNWYRRYRQRRLLPSLNERMLKDMGISRVDAEAEAAKPFWQP